MAANRTLAEKKILPILSLPILTAHTRRILKAADQRIRLFTSGSGCRHFLDLRTQCF